MKRFVAVSVIALALGLAACGQNGQLNTAGQTDVNLAYNAVEDSLLFYKSTPHFSQAVVDQANTLLAEATTQYNAWQAAPTDATLKQKALTAIASVSIYLLTSAPGDGVTPSTTIVPPTLATGTALVAPAS